MFSLLMQDCVICTPTTAGAILSGSTLQVGADGVNTEHSDPVMKSGFVVPRFLYQTLCAPFGDGGAKQTVLTAGAASTGKKRFGLLRISGDGAVSVVRSELFSVSAG
ncbi:MAG: hypothetical protein EA423_07015 [Phycisphaerales bacterium]|nr:MAG: hypothetical protein EA423_07015 [Phycisphaerales bacterium]